MSYMAASKLCEIQAYCFNKELYHFSVPSSLFTQIGVKTMATKNLMEQSAA
jgi:hypothetical protein